ncbi:MAG: hypothetical protein DMG88_10485 [Acidobacteria bacterium]|nr:MAG: hypothetical protein DMG88_10485 [Acidobacteriota bacterium]
MRVFRCLAIAGLTLFVASGSTQQIRCSNTEARRAEAQAETLRSWDDLYKSYTFYRQCDDAAIAEGTANLLRVFLSITGSLCRDWLNLPATTTNFDIS